jgi:hypothetical protein
VFSAVDIGLRLEALVRGQTYREFVAGRSPTDPPFLNQVWEAIGMDRLGAELELRAAVLNVYFGSGVLGSELAARRAELEREQGGPMS